MIREISKRHIRLSLGMSGGWVNVYPSTRPSKRRSFTDLGIRASFLLGFGVMVILMLVVSSAAFFITASTVRSTSEILDRRLPDTLGVLRAAQAFDALAGTGGPLISVMTETARITAFKRVEHAQQLFDQTLLDLQPISDASVASDVDNIVSLGAELTDNLDQLQVLANQRVALIQAKQTASDNLISILQLFQQLLTYRMRILESDTDVIALIMSLPSPPLERVGDMARETAPMMPLSRFHAEIAAIGSRQLAGAQDATLTALSLSRQIFSTALTNATTTLEKLPPELVTALEQPFAQLHSMAHSPEGLLGLREQELTLLRQSEALALANQQITARVNDATSVLVSRELNEIAQAGEAATLLQLRYQWALVLLTAVAVFGIAVFLYRHVWQYLIARMTLLSDNMQQIAVRNYDIKLAAEGDDELGRLGAAVRQFRAIALDAGRREADLQSSHKLAEEALAALEIKAQELEVLNAKLAELSTSDFLTGLANRRRFDEVFATEWARSTRTGSALAIIMLDVDHFKLFNDRYGHQDGDNCLRKLAEVLKQHVGRATDLAARYGGEEFCIISTDADLRGVLVLAERIRASIQAIAIKHEDSSVGVVTVSIGVASMIPSLDHDSAELLLAADHALYRAKASGRNCVTSA